MKGNIAISVTSFKAGLPKTHDTICPPKKSNRKTVNECAAKINTTGRKYHINGVSRTVRSRRKTLDMFKTKKKFVTRRQKVENGLAAAIISRSISLLMTREQKQRRAFRNTNIKKNRKL